MTEVKCCSACSFAKKRRLRRAESGVFCLKYSGTVQLIEPEEGFERYQVKVRVGILKRTEESEREEKKES